MRCLDNVHNECESDRESLSSKDRSNLGFGGKQAFNTGSR